MSTIGAPAYIDRRLNAAGQPRAYLAGTEVRVQDIYAMAEIHGRTPAEIVASLPQLTLAQVHAALSYYFDHRDEIVAEIRQDEDFVADMRRQLGPGPLQPRLSGNG